MAAKARAREILAAALAGHFDPRDRRPKRLGDAFDEYLRWCEDNRPKQAKRRKAVTKRLLDAIGNVAIDTLNPFAVEKFKRRRRKQGVKPATINRDLEVLSQFVGLAASWGWLSETRAKNIRAVPHLKEPPGRVRYLSADEEARLIAELSDPMRRIVSATLHSGMRQSEVVLLHKSAVDLDARMITLVRTKSNKVQRVHINESLAVVLKAAMAASKGNHVFVNRLGEPYTVDGVRSNFRRAVQRAGIEDFRFHDLRHHPERRIIPSAARHPGVFPGARRALPLEHSA